MSDDQSLLNGLWAQCLEAIESSSRDRLAEALSSILLLVESKNQELAQNIPVIPLISQLDEGHEEINDLICRIICVIIKTSDFESILQRFENLLVTACIKLDASVSVVIIEALKSGLIPECQERLAQSSFFVACFNLVINFDQRFGSEFIGLLLQSQIYKRYQTVIDDHLVTLQSQTTDPLLKLRILEAHARLRKTVGGLSLFTGFDEFVASPDSLIKIAAIGIIGELADCKEDFELLAVEGGIISQLLAMVPPHGHVDLSDDSLYSRILDLFAKLILLEGTDWRVFFLRLNASAVQCWKYGRWSRNMAIFLIACMLVNSSIKEMIPGSTIQDLIESFSDSSRDTQIACLYAATTIFSSPMEDQALHGRILREGIVSLAPLKEQSPFDTLVDFAKSTIEDGIKRASWECILAILNHRYLTEMALSTSSLFTFLLDRGLLNTMMDLSWKTSALKRVMRKSWAQDVFSAEMLECIRQAVAQGLSYRPVYVQVATQ